MTSMTRTPDPAETNETGTESPTIEIHFGAKIGLWLLVGAMALFAFGNLRDLIAAMLRQ